MNNYDWDWQTETVFDINKFWMITGDGNQPRVRHTNKKLATDEAERLARDNPGVKFYVLEAVEVFEQPSGVRRTRL